MAGVPISAAISARMRATTARHWDSEINTPFSSASRSRIRFAVWRCLRGASRSATSTSRIQPCQAPVTGAERSGTLRAAGSGDANAARTSRRCTPNRAANARMLNPSSRRARRTFSYNSTFDTLSPHLDKHRDKATTTWPGGANSDRRGTPQVGPNQTVVLIAVGGDVHSIGVFIPSFFEVHPTSRAYGPARTVATPSPLHIEQATRSPPTATAPSPLQVSHGELRRSAAQDTSLDGRTALPFDGPGGRF